MKPERCGVCENCIDHELTILSYMEETIWNWSKGHKGNYFEEMEKFIDWLNALGDLR